MRDFRNIKIKINNIPKIISLEISLKDLENSVIFFSGKPHCNSPSAKKTINFDYFFPYSILTMINNIDKPNCT